MEKGENLTFDQESLELTCLDLFKAGAETTSTTLLWCIVLLDLDHKIYLFDSLDPSNQHNLLDQVYPLPDPVPGGAGGGEGGG